ncbi:MAG: serine/threonine-protein kinase, partial [Pirellulaceae bacterium]
MTRPSIDDSCNPNLFQMVLQMEQRFRSPGGQQDEGAVDESQSSSLGHYEQQQLKRAEKYLQLLGSARHRVGQRDEATYCDDSTQRDPAMVEDRLPADAAIARKIGRFEVEEKLGHGGFSSVFLALDPHTGRRVALKVPRFVSLISSEARQRFHREARAAALLSHPAIVPVYEAGSSGPISYIAYEYCPGQTLAQWFHERDCKINHILAASIVARLADAVQHAHRRGVVHRDLKPANVLLIQREDESEEDLIGSLRITDFGLCKSTAGDEDSITEDGA